ncbi:hypothetical protein ACFXTN_033065 [Malus domestica]
MTTNISFFGFVLSFYLSVAIASDHSPLQDFCVADPKSQVVVNGLACKDPKTVEDNDFSFGGLHLEGNTSNPIGSSVTPVTVFQLPGLNTLGISLVRIDYAPSVSQQPKSGVVIIASSVFGSRPSIVNDILVKAFHVDKGIVNYLHSIF